MRTGAETGPCPRCGEPDGGRYEYDGEWRCWECLPPTVRRAPRKRRPPPDPYTQFVERVRSRLDELTGHRAISMVDVRQLASYCPVCLHGTLRLGFSWDPEPGFVILSRRQTDGDYSPEFWEESERLARYMGETPSEGTCSNGCDVQAIGEVLFS